MWFEAWSAHIMTLRVLRKYEGCLRNRTTLRLVSKHEGCVVLRTKIVPKNLRMSRVCGGVGFERLFTCGLLKKSRCGPVCDAKE